MTELKNFLSSKSAIRAYIVFAVAIAFDFLLGLNGAGMLLAMGDLMQAGDLKEHEDLADEIDVLFENERDMSLLSFVRFIPQTIKCMNEKLEWQDDEMPAESISVQASGDGADWDTTDDISDLPCAAAECAKLKVGDVLMFATGEVVIVSAIDSTSETIDLAKRGWGGTTATVNGHAAAVTAYIIGNAQVDGSDPMTENWRDTTECYNYVQIFEDTAGVSGKIMRSKITRNSEMARQLTIKLKRLLSQLNYAMLYGVREKYGDRCTFQGLRNRSTLTYNVNGSLTVAKVYGIVTAMINAGGSPSAFHGSADTIADLEQLFPSYVESSVSDWHAKLTVKKISLLGLSIEIHVDKHVSSSELLLLDYNRVAYGVQESDEATGSFKSYEIEKNGKQWKKHIVGYYVMRQKQAGASVCRAYGIT